VWSRHLLGQIRAIEFWLFLINSSRGLFNNIQRHFLLFKKGFSLRLCLGKNIV
jgi:hypothetical protein